MKDYNEMAESVFERRDKYNAERRMAMNKFKKGMTGAVCCCLVALLVAGVFSGNQIITNDTPNIGIEDYNENKLEAGKEKVGNEQVNNNTQTVEDIPADESGSYSESVNSNDLAEGTKAFFGGSYTDTIGKFVVVLTVDTAENRTAICKELGVSESTTVLKLAHILLNTLLNCKVKLVLQ